MLKGGPFGGRLFFLCTVVSSLSLSWLCSLDEGAVLLVELAEHAASRLLQDTLALTAPTTVT